MDTDSYESDSSSLERHHIENSHTKTLDETTESPTILIVEDDTSLRIFLNNLLSPHYRIIRAENGQEALNIIDQENIDLILTDLMMPVMDGFELCSFLKSHLEYSHIPIVILSAKTDMGSKITGLESGADAYIEKPFSGDYLMAQITTILSNRQIAKETFSRMPFVKVHSVATSSSDKIFLDTLTHMIEENLADENFCIDDLARMMNMSRSSLHRKMKGILQMTPNDFIRVIRLKKAAEMLAEGNYRVNEICFMVGFSSPSYFSKCFQKQYGVLPKNFIQ